PAGRDRREFMLVATDVAALSLALGVAIAVSSFDHRDVVAGVGFAVAWILVDRLRIPSTDRRLQLPLAEEISPLVAQTTTVLWLAFLPVLATSDGTIGPAVSLWASALVL